MNVKRRGIVWFLLFFLSTPVFAQETTRLCVIDEERLSALPGVLIYCNEKPVGVTNVEGCWEKTDGLAQGQWRLKMLGFVDTVFVWNNGFDMTIRMRPRDLES